MPKKIVRPNGFAPKKARAMGDMNVTPFIDVLLVLLIMLILAIPVQTHQTTVDLPTDKPCPQCVLDPETNTVFITANDELLWNGAAVTRDQLRTQVAAASAMEEQPLLRFEPAALASYDTSARTIALIKEEGAQTFAFVGNAQHKDFGS
ncbi:biopolymer transporter ExbD [uncultured Erythrobacter sp.]|uniref:ExbD/TolR family protein n=1 Tax=uncultured Erythrobacter sp. TaxID=263913 RepID=UPI0026222772|nr:biopolymer transporter ExbD [uncultured Erythrobacter sp.]